MFHVHAHHQTPFWWRHFAKFPAPAASDTQQKGPSDSGHIATKATNPRWSGSATRKACDSFSGPSVLLCLVLFHPFFGAEKDPHIPSFDSCSIPQFVDLKVTISSLKSPPFSWEKLGSPAQTPIDFVAPEALMRQSSSPSPQAFLGDDSPFGFNMIQEGGWWWFMLMNGKSHGKNSSTIMNQHEYCGNITGNIKNESNEHWLMLRVIVLSWDYSNGYKFFCLKK